MIPPVQIVVEPQQGFLASLVDFGRMGRRALDLSPILQQLPELVIFPSVRKSFAAGGRPPWKFHGWQSSPPMVKSGLMKRGLTSRDMALNTIAVTATELTFALNEEPYLKRSMVGDWGPRKGGRFKSGFFYPGAHQGVPQWLSSRHNINPVLVLQPEDIEMMADLVTHYIETGSIGRTGGR